MHCAFKLTLSKEVIVHEMRRWSKTRGRVMKTEIICHVMTCFGAHRHRHLLTQACWVISRRLHTSRGHARPLMLCMRAGLMKIRRVISFSLWVFLVTYSINTALIASVVVGVCAVRQDVRV